METKMIQYHCPDFYYGRNVYPVLIDIYEKHPEYFYDNVQINCIYGAFPTMIWNGGGILGQEPQMSINEIQNLKAMYDELGISLKLNLTNPLLIKEDCYDRYCNKVVELLEDEKNSILVTSPILEEYLRERFPGYKYCRSILATEYDDDYEAMLKQYYEVVLPRRKVIDFEYLNNIKIENRTRFELLCNDPCPISCPRLYSHYKDFAKVTLYEEARDNRTLCTGLDNTSLRNCDYNHEQIHYEDIVNKYLPLGYDQFKLSGRGHYFSVIHGLVKYLIKPEYQYEMIFYLLMVIG